MGLARVSQPDVAVPPARRESFGRPAGTDADAVVRQPGTELEPGLRESFGRRFGADFSTVRVHTDPAAAASAVREGAAAYTVGSHIVAGPRFGPGTATWPRLLAHELSHVAQQSMAQQSVVQQGAATAEALERDADQAAETVLAGRTARIRAVSAPAMARQAVADPFDALRAPQKKVTAAQAKAMLEHYETLPEPGRDAIVQAFHHPGVVGTSDLSRWLAALDAAEMERRRALVSDLAERVQRLTVEGQTGKNLEQLGAAQAAFMRQGETRLAEKEATAEAAKTGQPPKPVAPVDLARVHKKEAERDNPIGGAAKSDMKPEERAEWTARAAKVIAKMVEVCRREAPELGITASDFNWNPDVVLAHGAHVYALGHPIIFGTSFIETAEADPVYVVRTIVHEARGHPDFGDRFGSYEARIYDEAQRKHPELGGPVREKPDKDIYGYIGTEIYAALREVPYERTPNPEDAKLGLRWAIPPEQNVDNKVGLIKSKYAPEIAGAVLQGLYERYRIDPRISEDGLALFESTADKYFPGLLKGVPKRGPDVGLDLSAGGGLERAGPRTSAYTTIQADVALRWSSVALSAGLRFEAVTDKATFVRLGAESKLHARLLGSLYGDLRGGYLWGVSGPASSGFTAGAGVSYDLGRFELGLMYDYLKAADAKDPDAHRAFVSIGLRL